MAAWSILATALAHVYGCNPPPAPVAANPTSAPPLRTEELERAEAKSTRWRYHPSRPGELHGGQRLDDGTWLLVGEHGERWLARRPAPREERRRTLPADSPVLLAEPSARRLPETLRSVVAAQGGGWLFIGESGTIYSCAEPLGHCTRATAPPERLTRVVGTERGLLGLSLSGGIVRYRVGSGWSRQAPTIRRIFDVARTSEGALLGLSTPEKLLVSRDGGRHWAPLPQAPTIGAQRLVTTVEGGVLVEGVVESRYWDGRSEGLGLAAGQHPVELPLHGDWLVVPERGPRTKALAERRAAVSGQRYYEAFESAGERVAQAMTLLAPTREGAPAPPASPQAMLDDEMWLAPGGVSRWLWASGSLDRPLDVAPLPMATPCESVRLAANGRRVLLACVHFDESGDDVVVDLHVSLDGGTSWRPRATLASLDTNDVVAAVDGAGVALVAGVCAAGTEPCHPRAPLRLGLAGSGEPDRTSASELVSPPRALVFSANGRRAYFLGRRAKDEQVALFVSRDAGQSFTSRPLALPRTAAADHQEEPWDRADDSMSRSLHPGTDGQLGLVLGDDPPAYALADADGRLQHAARLPPDTLAVSGSGRWVFALTTGAPELGAPDRLVGWESSDGGLSFEQVSVTPALSVGEFDSVELRCVDAGCVVGSRATRIGWGRQREAPSASLRKVDEPLPPLEPAVRTPFDCELEPSGWTSIDEVAFDGALPGVAQTMRGDAVWSLLRHVSTTGEVVAISARLGRSQSTVDRHVLLPAHRRSTTVAVELARQMEGYATARLQLSRAAGATVPRGPLELGWIDFVHGSAGRASLPLTRGMPTIVDDDQPRLVTGLLSVAPSGLFVRPSRRIADTYLVDPSGRTGSALPYPEWRPARGKLAQTPDAIMSQGKAFAIVQLRDADRHLAAVGVAGLAGPRTSETYATLAPPDDDDRQVDTGFAYVDSEAGITVHAVDPRSGEAWASFSRVDRDGGFAPATALPTQVALPEPPRPCTATERRSTARQVAPFVAGTRHPVLIRSLAESYVLLTEWAVLHGTVRSPCVAAWTASQLQRSPAAPITAVIGGEPDRSWAFRPTPGKRGSVDYRAMRCRRSPGAEIPRTVWLEPGAMRRRR